MRLVAAVDLKDPELSSVRWALSLSRATGSGMEVVHVAQHGTAPGALQRLRARRPESVQRIVEEARSSVRRHLEGVEGLPSDLEVSVLVGRPSRALADWIGAVEDGILVVGAGKRRWLDGVVGTTTDRLLRMSPRPTVVARGDADVLLDHVLAAVDLDAGAERVVAEATRWALRVGARLTLFHVPQPRWSNAFLEGRGEHELDEMFETPEEMRDRAREGLRRLAKHPEREGLEVETEVGEPGTIAAEGVTARVVQEDVGLTVTGTHGVSAIDRMILGSVAEGVIQTSHGPTLVVPVGG